jgi:hypothetical protein
MENTVDIAKRERRFFCGGAPALYLSIQAPTGNTAAERHLALLTERLEAYTQSALLPLAVQEWENAVKSGQGYRFLPHRVAVSLTYSLKKRWRFTLRLTVQTANGVTQARELITEWSEGGTYQLAPRRRKKAGPSENS